MKRSCGTVAFESGGEAKVLSLGLHLAPNRSEMVQHPNPRLLTWSSAVVLNVSGYLEPVALAVILGLVSAAIRCQVAMFGDRYDPECQTDGEVGDMMSQ